MSKLVSLLMSFIWVGTAFGAKLVWIETLTSPMFNDGMIWPTGKARYFFYRFYFQKIQQYLCFLFQKLFKSKSLAFRKFNHPNPSKFDMLIFRAFVVTSTQNHRKIHLFNIIKISNKFKICQDHRIRKYSNNIDLRIVDFLSAEKSKRYIRQNAGAVTYFFLT